MTFKKNNNIRTIIHKAALAPIEHAGYVIAFGIRDAIDSINYNDMYHATHNSVYYALCQEIKHDI